jgi:hypothetical protein
VSVNDSYGRLNHFNLGRVSSGAVFLSSVFYDENEWGRIIPQSKDFFFFSRRDSVSP